MDSYCEVGRNLRIEDWHITTGLNTIDFHRLKMVKIKTISSSGQSS